MASRTAQFVADDGLGNLANLAVSLWAEAVDVAEQRLQCVAGRGPSALTVEDAVDTHRSLT